MTPKLLIFDCDGVLMDSEIIADAIILDYCAERFPLLDFSSWQARMNGIQIKDILARMEAELNIRFPSDADQDIVTRLDQRLMDEVQAVPGVAELLASLQLPRAVVSNSYGHHVRTMLDRTGLLTHFGERIFGVDSVERPKPHPDIYLNAVRSLGEQPEDCLAVEDSVTGVTAAVAAGIEVIGFLGGSHSGPHFRQPLLEAGAARVIDHMAMLPEVLV